MEILARIPDLAVPPPSSTVPTSTVPPARSALTPSPRRESAEVVDPPTGDAAITPAPPSQPRQRRAGHRPRFPARSVILLAVVAGLVWTAVTWQERANILRKSPRERWSEAFASEPAGDEAGRLR